MNPYQVCHLFQRQIAVFSFGAKHSLSEFGEAPPYA
jgi:hypothetical protein